MIINVIDEAMAIRLIAKPRLIFLFIVYHRFLYKETGSFYTARLFFIGLHSFQGSAERRLHVLQSEDVHL